MPPHSSLSLPFHLLPPNQSAATAGSAPPQSMPPRPPPAPPFCCSFSFRFRPSFSLSEAEKGKEMASSSANSCASSSSAFSSRPSSITHLPVAVISPNAPWPSLPTDQQLKVRPLHHNNHNHNNFCSESSSAHSSLQSAGQHNTRPLLLTDGQHRASWANLLVDIVDSRFNKTPSKSVAEIGNGGKLGFLQPTTFDAPPPYDQLHGNHVVGGQQLGAYRQYSNASAGTETSSGPFSVSKGSNSFFNFRFGEPGGHHFPLGQARPPTTVAIPPMATALRAGSALSSGGHPGSGGGSSAGAGSSRRSLQARSRATDNKRDRMQELRDLWARPGCRLCCLLLFLLLIGLIVAAVLLNNHLALPQHLEFAWFAPEQLRSTGSSSISNAAGGAATPQSGPNRGRLDVGQLGQQVRLELSGAPPFRSNFISVFDFKTNQVAIVDLSLRSGQRNLVCFVVDLDRQNIHDMEAMLRAAKAGASRRNQLYGWEESWTWVPNPLSQSPIFQPEVAECRGARWVKLTRAGADQKGQKCSECFDFCLPDWGIQRDAIRDEDYLNILRRLCFSLFVPEWRPFAQSLSWQQNQHDFEQFYRGQQQFTIDLLQQQQQQNAQKASQQTGGSETKWISLQTPQQQQSPTFGSAGASQPQQQQQQQWPFQQSFAGTAAGQFPASSAVLNNVKSAASEQLQQQLPYLLPSASSWAQQQQPAIWPSISNQQQPQQQPTINNQQQSGLVQLNSGQQSGQMPLQQQQPSAAGVQQQPANGQQQQPSDTAQQQQWPQMQPQHPTVNGGEGQQQQQQKWLR